MKKKMIARLSFTDFDGKILMEKYEKSKILDNEFIKNLAPKIVEGTEKLKKWSESI